MSTHRQRWDAYFVPDASGEPTSTLKNNLGITDPQELAKTERSLAEHAATRILTGETHIERTFDMAHLRAIHRALFQDLYPWAGKPRTVGISKGFTDFAAPGPEVAHAVKQAQHIIECTPWTTVDDHGFATHMAEIFAWLNYAHPFREGNGRTTRVFLKDVAALAHRELHFRRITPPAWNQRSELTSPDRGSHQPVPDAMIEVFHHISAPARQIGRHTPTRPLIDAINKQVEIDRQQRESTAPSEHHQPTRDNELER